MTCEHICIDATGHNFGRCKLEAGHRGRHSTVAFTCDGCGNRRRCRPQWVGGLGANDDADEGIRICFMCVREQEQARDDYEQVYDNGRIYA